MRPVIIKRDGKAENYDPEKIVKVVMAAGLDLAPAQKLAAEVTSWIKKSGFQKLTSIELRDFIAEKLNKYDESAAKMFIWYQTTKSSASPESGKSS